MRHSLAVAWLLTLPLAAQKKDIEVAGNKGWVDSGIVVAAGDTLKLTASGKIAYAAGQEIGPEGADRRWMDLMRTLPLNNSPRGAAIGRIGDSAAVRPFVIGAGRDLRSPIAGRLFLGINQPAGEPATGAFTITVEKTAGIKAEPVDKPLPKITQQMIDSVPRRVEDDAGTPGDRTNFLIVGDEQNVVRAFEDAGWVRVDRDVKSSILRGALGALSRQAYVTLPMSLLRLFGRVQDYGFAQGDPVKVIAARHHFRLWRAPFTAEGRQVWVGAGTHDIGFDRDQRNGKLTHKIDPEVDKEREYIGESLRQTGKVVKTEYLTPGNPVNDAKTAHGGTFRSDGRTLVIYLTPEGGDQSSSFGDLFCSVLRRNPDGGDWGPCGAYLRGEGKTAAALPALPNRYRVLIIPGFFSSCFPESSAFAEGQESLKKMGLTVDLLGMPNDSSEDNAKKIGQFIREQRAKDPRKFIVIGYSKGAPDVQTALAMEGIASGVAAFISVAGASGGSPVADTMPQMAEQYIRQFKLSKCEGDASAGFKSLKREVRQAFLSRYPDPLVPTYSLAAVAEKGNISKSLEKTAMVMAAYDRDNDGQLTRGDATVPGSKVLGVVRSDHFALALPFDKSPDAMIRQSMDKTRFPRAALLEALIRQVVADLDGR